MLRTAPGARSTRKTRTSGRSRSAALLTPWPDVAATGFILMSPLPDGVCAAADAIQITATKKSDAETVLRIRPSPSLWLQRDGRQLTSVDSLQSTVFSRQSQSAIERRLKI